MPRVSFDVGDDAHARIKAAATRDGTGVAEYAREAALMRVAQELRSQDAGLIRQLVRRVEQLKRQIGGLK